MPFVPPGRAESRPPVPVPTASLSRRVNRIVLWAATFAAAAAYALAYARHPQRPDAPAPGLGWWVGYDQSRYLRAAAAWASGDLDPARHWYLPGYPLLGAPFVGLTPSNPFLVPDLAGLLASLWLTAALTARLAPGWAHAPALGASAFLGVVVLSPTALDAWVVPWTSSLAAPLTLACLVAALAGSAGVACGALLVVVPYVAVHGWAWSEYLAGAARYGFEWRLVPLRWVILVLSPRPLFPDGRGLAEVFVWLVPGVAGMAACLAAPPGRGTRWVHAVIASAAAGQLLLYLAYRDLHPQGLWRYGNHHYLKGLLPLFGVYALLLVAVAARRRWAGLAAGAAALLVLVPWRAELVPLGPVPGRVEADGGLVLPPLRLGVGDAVLIGAEGAFAAIFHDVHTLRVGERTYRATDDFKLFPRSGGVVLMPLRPLGAGPVRFSPARDADGQAPAGAAPGVALRPGVAPILARARVVPGLPCWAGASASRCRSIEPLPLPALPADGVLRFDGTETAFLGEGWSGAEPGGRWTDGEHTEMRLPLSGPSLVALHGYAFVPPGAAPLGLRLFADGEEVGAWRIGAGERPAIEARLSRGGDAGAVTLTLAFDAPRRPGDFVPGSRDTRRLGLFVHSVAVTPRP